MVLWILASCQLANETEVPKTDTIAVPDQKALSISTRSLETDAGNLLVNPGAETGDFSGWNRWGMWGVDATAYNGVLEGEHCFLTSYNWCIRSQEVDLLSRGYSAADLDNSFGVDVSEWFSQAISYCSGV